MIFLNLRKRLAKESLARARKRVRDALKQSANAMIYNEVFNGGINGYLRDRNCYGK